MATPSVKMLQKVFPMLSAADAKTIRLLMQGASGDKDAEKVLYEASLLIKGYGVEVIRGPHFHRGYWADAVLAYVNTGDSYRATIGFEPGHGFAGRFVVLPGGWGSWVEWYERKHGEVL